MIDMQDDSGHVQHDGFEYNWIFQQRHWRAQVGTLSAGGFVRRRRWIRLMMRPSRLGEKGDGGGNVTPQSTPITLNLDLFLQHRDSRNSASYPPSVQEHQSDDFERWANAVWFGEDRWYAYSTLMKMVGRDGRKLEVWRRWLGCQKQPSGVDSPVLSPTTKSVRQSSLPPRDRIELLLQENVSILISQDHILTGARVTKFCKASYTPTPALS